MVAFVYVCAALLMCESWVAIYEYYYYEGLKDSGGSLKVAKWKHLWEQLFCVGFLLLNGGFQSFTLGQEGLGEQGVSVQFF